MRSNNSFTLRFLAVFVALVLVMTQTPFGFAGDPSKDKEEPSIEQVSLNVEKSAPVVPASPSAVKADADKPVVTEVAASTPSESSIENTVSAEKATVADAPEATLPSEFVFEDATLRGVVVVSEPSSLPEGAQLVVTELNAEKQDAKAFAQKLEALASKDGRVVAAYKLYEVYFVSNGTRVDLASGSAKVSLEYKQASSLGAASELSLSKEDVSLVRFAKEAGLAADALDITDKVQMSEGKVSSVSGATPQLSVLAVAAMSEAVQGEAVVVAAGPAEENLVETAFEFHEFYYAEKSIVSNAKFDVMIASCNEDGSIKAANDAAQVAVRGADGKYLEDGKTVIRDYATTSAFDENGQSAVLLPTIKYAAAGDYCYKVWQNGSEGHNGWDTSYYVVKVSVAANEASGLLESPRVSYSKNGEPFEPTAGKGLDFYNNQLVTLGSYAVSVDSSDAAVERMCWANPKVKTMMLGSSLVEDQFTFGVWGVDEAGVKEAEGPMWIQTNDAYGLVDFDFLGIQDSQTGEWSLFQFNQPGNHWYVIEEMEAAQEDSEIVYDSKQIFFNIVVFEDADGKLGYSIKYYDAFNGGNELADPTFVNTTKDYDPRPWQFDLQVMKTDADTGAALPGATYGLYQNNEEGADIYLMSATSDAEGVITYKDVELTDGGQYYLLEENAPEGYILDAARSQLFSTDALSASTVDNKTVYVYSGTNGKGVADNKMELSVVKTDQADHKYVEGAELAIVDKASGEELVTWTTEKEVRTFVGSLGESALKANTPYILRDLSESEEGEAAVPDTEFNLDNAGSVYVTEGENAEVVNGALTLYNKPVRAMPAQSSGQAGSSVKTEAKMDSGSKTSSSSAGETSKTGDGIFSIMGVLAAVVAVALLALVVAGVMRRRKEK